MKLIYGFLVLVGLALLATVGVYGFVYLFFELLAL